MWIVAEGMQTSAEYYMLLTFGDTLKDTIPLLNLSGDNR